MRSPVPMGGLGIRRVTVGDHAEFRARMAADLAISARSENSPAISPAFPAFIAPILTCGAIREGANEPNGATVPMSETQSPEKIRP
jgi:hypothetical protein